MVIAGIVIAVVLMCALGAGGYWYIQRQDVKKANPIQKQQLATSAPTGTTGHYTNPFDYCKAVVDKDSEGEGGIIDNRYVGTNPPDVVVNVMMKKFNVAGPYTWRCMDGEVYGCYLGASGRACMKPESSESKRQMSAMSQFCQQNPNSNVPNAVNNTASQWRCNGTIPVIDNAYPTAPVDKRGYYKDAWYTISPYVSPAPHQVPATSVKSVPATPKKTATKRSAPVTLDETTQEEQTDYGGGHGGGGKK